MSHLAATNKKINIKLWDGTKHSVLVKSSDTYEDFVKKVSEISNPGTGKSIKFICKGKITNVHNFNDVEPGSLMLCLTTQSASNASNVVDTSNHTQQNSINNKPQEPVYNYKNVKATLVVFLDLIRSNKQLKHLYENDYGQLVTEILKNPDLDTMLKNILSQSGQIMNAMEKGENISVNVKGNTDEDGGRPGDMDVIDLSIQDQETIEEITSMGFSRTDVVVAYMSCNKDRDNTINKLISE